MERPEITKQRIAREYAIMLCDILHIDTESKNRHVIEDGLTSFADELEGLNEER